MPGAISNLLLPQAANNRHGLVFSPQIAHLSKSDVPKIFHVGVPFSSSSLWKSASGGVAFSKDNAILAGIGEGVERYCAAIAQVPLRPKATIEANNRIDPEEWTLFSKDQRTNKDFSFGNLYAEKCLYTNVFDMKTNNETWVPHPLVVLRDDYETGIPTSSGLAAGQTATNALLRAIQELIERDALMATWLHSLSARAIAVPEKYSKAVNELSGDVTFYDLTPKYSSFPVIAVAGGIPKRGKWRFSLGVACRETLEQTMEKAYLEWCQGVFFSGVYPKYAETQVIDKPSDVNSFDDHAIYYTGNPQQWHKIPLSQNRRKLYKPSANGIIAKPHIALQKIIKHLDSSNIRLFYRDLTTVDALQAGVRVVRVLSPDLIPINAHHNWPFLGGNAANVKLRYPWAKSITSYPNPFPHPLG